MTRNSSRSPAQGGPVRLGFDTPAIDRISSKAALLDLLDALLRSTLPPNLGGGCRLANLRAGKLVWLVSDAAAGVRLKPHLPELERLASAETNHPIRGSIIRIEPKTTPQGAPREPSTTERAYMLRLAGLLGLDSGSAERPDRN